MSAIDSGVLRFSNAEKSSFEVRSMNTSEAHSFSLRELDTGEKVSERELISDPNEVSSTPISITCPSPIHIDTSCVESKYHQTLFESVRDGLENFVPEEDALTLALEAKVLFPDLAQYEFGNSNVAIEQEQEQEQERNHNHQSIACDNTSIVSSDHSDARKGISNEYISTVDVPILRQNSLPLTSSQSLLLVTKECARSVAVDRTSSIEVIVFHKPRGCKGVWQQVEQGDGLRVTKGKGKWLKLTIINRMQTISPSKVDIFLLSSQEASQKSLKLCHSEDEGIQIESISESWNNEIEVGHACDVELKLNRVFRSMRFYATVNTPNGVLIGRSVEFSAHNNGKASKKENEISDGQSPLASADDASPGSISNAVFPFGTMVPSEDPLQTTTIFSPGSIPFKKRRRRRSPKENLDQQRQPHHRMDSQYVPGDAVSSYSSSFDCLNRPDPERCVAALKTDGSSEVVTFLSERNESESGWVGVKRPRPRDIYSEIPSTPIDSPISFSQDNAGMNGGGGGVHRNEDEEEILEQVPVSTTSTVIPGSLRVNGVIRAKAFLQLSDLRLKADIMDIADAVNIISKLEGKTYTWRHDKIHDETGGRRVIGLIAQEVQKVLPEVVHRGQDGYLSVSYAEIVPVLVEAFKSHLKQYEGDKEDVRLQLAELRDKLDLIQLGLESDAREQWLSLSQATSSPKRPIYETPETMCEGPSTGPPLLIEEYHRWKANAIFKRTIYRTAVVISFLIGLTALVFGAILLGSVIASPHSSLSTEVFQAEDLKSMNSDGEPNPFCEVIIGDDIFRTETIWNSIDPVWNEDFFSSLNSGTSSITYQIYDDNSNPSFPPRRMGYATLSLSNITTDVMFEAWLSLQPNLEGDTTSGSVQVSVLLFSPKQVNGFMLSLFIGGFLLTIVSVFCGVYLWKSGEHLSTIDLPQ